MGTVLFACAFVFVAVVGDLSCLTGQSHQQVDSDHNEIVFKFSEREFSKLELDKVRARHFAVVKFLEALEKKARQMPADDFYSGLPPALRISPANSSTDNPDQIDSFENHLRRLSVDLEVRKSLMRHRDISTTIGYGRVRSGEKASSLSKALRDARQKGSGAGESQGGNS